MVIMKLAPGRNRVEAWIYGVINPLAEAIEREVTLAGLHRPTYQWRTESLERILPLRGYLSRGAILILEDLVGQRPEVKRWESNHDACVEVLRRSAQKTFEALVHAPAFRSLVEEHFSAVSDGSDQICEDVAEDLVNDAAEMVNPKKGSYRETWNRHLESLQALREPAFYPDLLAALEHLREASQHTLAACIELRSELVQEFDVPPAPLGL